MAYAASLGPSGWIVPEIPRNISVERSRVVARRQYGQIDKWPSGAASVHLTLPAPARFVAVQLELFGAYNNPANLFSFSVAAPAARGVGNNFATPLNAAGQTMSFVPVTWGTTQPSNPRNPGGGAANIALTSASGTTAAQNLIEGSVLSDWIPLQGLPRTDGGSGCLFMLRGYGTEIPIVQYAESAIAHANTFTAAEPDHFAYAWSNVDNTANSAATVLLENSAAQGWLPGVAVRFLLADGVSGYSIGVAGDSIDQGAAPFLSVPQFGGRINGWGRRLVGMLNAAGIVSTYHALCHSGNTTTMFHQRAINALLNGGLTHLFVKPMSINDGSTSAALDAALTRTVQILELCREKRVQPILIRPWGGQGTAATGASVQAFVDNAKARGVPALECNDLLNVPGSLTTLQTQYLNRDSSGAIIDTTHPNDAGMQLVAQRAFAMRGAFGLA